ncbi:hypothetical protein T492DRAFT_919289 [Pavlovales sp. CCMP2436]|nr:hypothetical protein T492DRAFT_919289 [Pavlovales sp. CCMP2436]
MREVTEKLRMDQASVPAADNWDDAAAGEESCNAREAEYGGPRGLEPTRFGDWERKGRCSDF